MDPNTHPANGKFLRRLATLAAVGVVSASLVGFTAPATAADGGEVSLAALQNYAQQVDVPAAGAARQGADRDMAALQDFAQRLGPEQPQSVKNMTKVADEPATLFDFLNGKSGNGTASEAPKTAAPVKKVQVPVEAHAVGSKVCGTCHAALVASFNKTLMGKIGQTPNGKGKFECENCHGPGSAHVKAGGGRGVGGILSFGADDPRSVDERNGICLACHQKGERNYWAGSVHQTRGLACTDCHTVMKDVSRKHQLKTVKEMDTCFQCHKLQQVQIQYSSHMPLREGKITCSDCHNPHGSITESLIREASINDNCYKCHAEKRGPMLWEHAPVRENCLNCHNPHGSNYENLLKVARPRLCHECHAFAHGTGGFGPPTTAYLLQNACGNCHSNIHGSNHPNGQFFLR